MLVFVQAGYLTWPLPQLFLAPSKCSIETNLFECDCISIVKNVFQGTSAKVVGRGLTEKHTLNPAINPKLIVSGIS